MRLAVELPPGAVIERVFERSGALVI